MKTPPLLMGAAILFWGWQSGLLPIAALLAAALEASRIVKIRWELAASNFNRIADFCAVLFLGTAVYLVSTKGMPHAVIALFVWMPLVLLPLIAAQVFSSADTIDLSVLFFSLRKKAKQNIPTGKVNLTYPYFAICLLSASAANIRTPQFYLGLIVLGAWALWFTRSRRFSTSLWAGLLLGIAALGYVGHIGLHRLQGVFEDATQEWFTGGDGETDPYNTTTAIGHIGEMKLSDKIVLRVDADKNTAPPFLLHEASYDIYFSANWSARDADFTRMPPSMNSTSWILRPDKPSGSMTVTKYLKRGKGMLALPNGTVQVADLPALEVKQNRLGAVELEQKAGMVTYRALFAPSISAESPPTANDLKLPPQEAQVVSNIAASLRLAEHTQQEIPGIVKNYFQQNFRYSTYQRGHDSSTSPLTDFLLKTKSGHCEYFASATTLLLRAAGIPSRYAVGYSVQEFSKLENKYVARARHAHAWTRVYLDGVWQDLDTTPGSWLMAEEENAPAWEPVTDLWYWVVLQFSKWRESNVGVTSSSIGWLGLPLFIFLVWRLYFKKRTTASGNKKQLHTADAWQGKDSEFYLIEQFLAGLGYGRAQGESLEQWLNRLNLSVISQVELDALNGILELHHRYRFDPVGISTEDRNVLKEKSHIWLAAYNKSRSSQTKSLIPST